MLRRTRGANGFADVPSNAVVEIDGAPMGQASGTAVTAGQVELISMWVDPAVRGSGAAALLIEAVCDSALICGADRVRLSVRRRNDRAIRSHLARGFMIAEEAGDEPTELTMVRDLRAARPDE